MTRYEKYGIVYNRDCQFQIVLATWPGVNKHTVYTFDQSGGYIGLYGRCLNMEDANFSILPPENMYPVTVQ